MSGERPGDGAPTIIPLTELLRAVFTHAANSDSAHNGPGYDVEAGVARFQAFIDEHGEEVRMGVYATEVARMEAHATGDTAGELYTDRVLAATALQYGSHVVAEAQVQVSLG